jgi:hypothetical protein
MLEKVDLQDFMVNYGQNFTTSKIREYSCNCGGTKMNEKFGRIFPTLDLTVL